MTVIELKNKVNSILAEIPDGTFDGMCILEDFGNISDTDIALHPERDVPESICSKVIRAAQRRECGYPLQYILGEWEFYGRRFKVGEGVLIPRPDTEALADAMIEKIKAAKKDKPRILDLCSGSGCLAVTAAKEIQGAEVYAVELSSEAFPYLIENIRINDADVKVIKGDVFDGRLLDNFRDNEGEANPFDCIISNPPYLTDKEMEELQKEVTFEPQSALYGGTDGLKFYRVIACLWKEVLSEKGLLIFEIGDRMEDAVSQILAENGFSDIFYAKDGSGLIRVVGGRAQNNPT
ncbi:MAG: peptide chain release factor N(5)-glutamine methyltransferase [Huintestinicola sp.]